MTKEDNKLSKTTEKSEALESISSLKPCKKIDLRTTECPLNFVKSKLALEKLNSSDILEIWLSEGESIINVPESLRLEGHKILQQEKIDDYYVIKVERA